MDLRDRVAVVTGAGRGIGRSIAQTLGAEGARVVLAARTLSELEAAAEEIRRSGSRAEALPVDLSSEESVTGLFSEVERRCGGLDILVNNAGIGLFGPIAEFSAADLDRLYQVNVRGTFLCCQQALRLMGPRRQGAIINIASVMGTRGYANQAGYTATKHAVMGLTKVLAVEAQELGIRVSVVLPGGVDTEMVGSARPDLDRSVLLQPEDVAQTVRFLLTLPPRAAVDEVILRRSASKPF